MSPLSGFWLYIRQTYGEFIFALAFGAKIGGGAISRWRSAAIFALAFGAKIGWRSFRAGIRRLDFVFALAFGGWIFVADLTGTMHFVYFACFDSGRNSNIKFSQ